jgi:tetratricopeptide (TPR) repeat protein
LPDTVENRRGRVDTLIKRVASSWLADSPEENLERLVEAERVVGTFPDPDGILDSDRVRRARVHYWMGRIHQMNNALPEAFLYYGQVLPVGQEIGDPELIAIPSAAMGQALLAQGRTGKAELLLRQALIALEQQGSLSDQVRAVVNHGLAIATMGDYAEGMAELQLGLARAQEMGSVPLSCLAQLNLAVVHILYDDPLQAVEAARKLAEAAEQSGHWLPVYWGRGFEAWAEARAGQSEAAEATMAQSQAIAQEVGGRLLFEDWFLVARADIALAAKRIQEALDRAKQAVATAQEIDNPGVECGGLLVWGQALAALEPPRWDEAEARFAGALRTAESVPSPPQAAYTHLVWGTACRDRGDLAAAREHWAQASALWEACGITWQVEKARALIATLREA